MPIKPTPKVRTIVTDGLRLTRRQIRKLQSYDKRKTPRTADSYRAARRNAAERPVRRLVVVPSRPWPWPDAAKLAAAARHARRKARGL